MSDYANQRWFDQPGAILRAQGFDYKQAFGAHPGEASIGTSNGGIINPCRAELARGTAIVRFGNAARLDKIFDDWWLDDIEFRRVVRFAEAQNMPVGTALRELCCVPWGELDIMIEAQVVEPLLVYHGFGAPAFDKGRQINAAADLGGVKVKQLYIPGLANPDLRRTAIRVVRSGFVPQAPRT